MKGHPRNVDWGFFALIALTTLFVGLFFGFVAWAASREYEEPTSRCIDSKYRIFERGGEEGFSVVEDASCA